MRILHVVPTYLPATRYGGPIYAVHGLCRSLASLGHDVRVFTTNVDGRGVSDIPLGVPVERDGVRITYFPSPFPRLYWSPKMGNALEAEVHTSDIVHLHSVFLWPTFAAARAASRECVPYVISPRGMLVPELIRRRSRVVKHAWMTLIERRNFAGAASIHFTSQREWDDARRLRMALPSPFVIPNGIDLRLRSNVAREPQTILYLGRINWKKGIDRLIEALPRIEGARLQIVGNDEEVLTPRLRQLAAQVGVADRVAFRGSVDGDAKWELLARAAVVALPSLSENFGNVILEAMMMETPVVVSEEVGIAPDVRTARAGVVSNDVAAALREAMDNPELGRNGRALVESTFTWPAVARQTEEAYRCSIASRR